LTRVDGVDFAAVMTVGSAALRIQVLGPLVAHRDRAPVPVPAAAQRVVLGLLAVSGGRTVPRTALVQGLWHDRDVPATAVNIIQTHVTRLRRRLEPDRPSWARTGVVAQVGDGYALRAEGVAVDLLRFRELVEASLSSRATGAAEQAAALLDEALGLWHGPPLADLPGLAGHPAVAGLDGEHRAAIARYGDLMIALGSAAEALPRLEQAAAAHPLDEVGQARLIRALGAAGRRGQAFDAYHEARRRLAEELGVGPGPELVTAYTELLSDGGGGARAEGSRRSGGALVVAPMQLPADLAGFTGRGAQLAALDGLAAGARGTLVVAVSGTAGVGKTVLAVHWAHRAAERFPDGQLFLDLRGFDQGGQALEPAEAVRDLLDALHVPPERIPAGLAARTALFRSLVAGRRMLVVLDNARDPAQVRPLLPGAPGCVVLVTSRVQLLGLVATEGAHPLGLDLLSPAEARDLLAGRLGSGRIAAEPSAAAEIVARCAQLPLALAIAAARAAVQPGRPLQDLAAELRDERTRLDALATDEHSSAVRSVFSWSYRALTPTAATLFRRIGLHPGPVLSLPAVLSLAGAPTAEVRPGLAELTRASLLTEISPGRYSGHDLLHAYAAELAAAIDGHVSRRAARRRLLDHYLHTARAADRQLLPHREPPITLGPAAAGTAIEPPADRDRAMAWFDAEHRTLVALTGEAAATGFEAHAARLAWTLCTYFQWRGHWTDQLATQDVARQAAERLDDESGQAHAHHHLARAHAKLSDPDAARAHYAEALRLFARRADHAGQAHTHLGLGAVFEQQRDHHTALDHAQRALELFRRADNRPGQANAMNSAGWCHAQLGDHERAIAACRAALALQQQIGDRDGEAATWDSLGYAHLSLDRHAEAVDCYARAIDLRRELGDRYYEAATLQRLGDAQLAAGAADLAAAAWRAALDILEALGHPDADRVRSKLGTVEH
jgi:DNA-binding SARP family transcriptional activator